MSSIERTHGLRERGQYIVNVPADLQPIRGEPGQALSQKESQERFNHAEQFLKEARLSWDRDDVPGMERALESYVHDMKQLEGAINRRHMPPGERREVAEIVSRTTSRHADVLLELGDKGAGQTGINWALEEAIMQLVFCKLAWQRSFP